MIRHKKFIIAVLIVVALLGGGFFYYRHPSVQEKIKNAAVQALSSAIDGEVKIGSLSVGFFSATATDIELSINSKSFQVEIKKIKIGLGIMKMPFFSKLSPQYFIDRLVITSPRIKIIPYADSTQEESEKLLCSQLSKLIVESVPFKSARIKDCSILVVTKKDRVLADFNGLNGELKRKNGELNIDLSGSSKTGSKKNIFIASRISPIPERQFATIKFESLAVSSPLVQTEGDLSFVISGDADILFADKYFPEAIIPNGSLLIRDLQIHDKSRGIIFGGAMDIFASGGVLTATNIDAKFGGGKADGYVQMDLNQSGKATGNVIISLPFDDKNSLTVKNEIYLTDVISPKIFFNTEGNIKRDDKIDTLYGAGRIIDEKAVLDSLLVEMRDVGRGSFSGFIVPGVNYKLDGEMEINAKIDQDAQVVAKAKASIKGGNFETLPTITGSVSDMKLTQGNKEIYFPKSQIQTIRDTLKLDAKDDGFSLSGEVKLNEKFPYAVNLNVSEGKIKELFEMQGKNFPLKDGSVSFQANGDVSGLNFNSNVSLFTNNYGRFFADAKGEINEKQKIITIDSAKWLFNENTAVFNAQIKDTAGGWSVNLADEKETVKLHAVLDTNFQNINLGQITINKFPLDFFSNFIKSKKTKQNLIKTGNIYGNVLASGTLTDIVASGGLKIQNAHIGNAENLDADFSFSFSDSTIKFPKFVVKQNNNYLIRTKRLEKSGEKIYVDASVENLKLEDFLPIAGVSDVKGKVNVWIEGSDGDEINLNLNADSVFYQDLKTEKINAYFSFSKNKFSLDEFDAEALGIKTNFDFSAVHKDGKIEEAKFNARLNGDFLAAAGRFKESPVGGKGTGSIYFSGSVSDGIFNITDGRILIPKGQLTVFPFARGNIENVFADVKIINNDSVSVAVQGTLDKKQLTVRNDYDVGDLTPFQLANLNFGVLRVWTDKGGIPVFLPGFMENRRGNVGWIETAKKDDIPTFTVASHPDNLVTLAGTLLLRKAEITFPLLNDVEYPYDFDPFPSLFFDLDIRSADRSVNYFYQLGSEKRRRSIRIIECVLDPSGTIGVRGNDADGTFKVVGSLRSYNGYIFYGRMFDQNLEIGLDFQPELLPNGTYNNLPIIWGRAETYSDTNRLERISVKLKTRDEITGELRDRGRFTELVIFPESDNIFNPANKAASDYYTGIYSTFADYMQTGELASQVGDAFMNTYFLNYWGRQFARKVGLDMFRFETSVMKNSMDFLIAHQLDANTTRNWNYLAFANSSFTIGKYIFGNNMFLKYQTEFVPSESGEPNEFTLTPTYKVGVEYQPLPYLWMDFNYGFFRETQTEEFVANPEVRLQLRLPFNIFKKKSAESKKDDDDILSTKGGGTLPPPPP